ncbi:conserved protein of unknown function [Modestobacter italicus]|uniref:DUF3263 domain-containing protein n=1 Tax=Modestobacter italicus (strain DSM 44449 / CECT 9708 / BC 501) TaxID=2732864 RepID=I4ES65_MODI5|nr:DUF3263 domain-containing protein [Modestobacter marinus]CCH86228.1 conserved protein of unknown function [Modestobacter marinus]
MSSETGSELRDAEAAAPAATPEGGAAGTGGTPGNSGASGLPAREREILAFERQWWRFAGAKEEAIRERFGMSATRYYQVLNALVDRPEALAADPLLVRRLRRMRGARQRQRSGRVLGSDPLRD